MRRHDWRTWILPFVGLVSLVWFLLRVGPKPSRAVYPCQRVAGPLAGGFVLWLGGLLASTFAFRGAKYLFRHSRVALALVCLAVAVGAGLVALIHMPERPAWAADPDPLAPLGIARGIHPGRVVWVHDPAATDWDGPGDGHWWEPEHTNQAIVDTMMSKAVRAIGGQATNAASWDAIFRYFNLAAGKGDVGYTPGEKICIKVNFVGFIASGVSVDPVTYDIVYRPDYMNTSPQMIKALLRQLVYEAGVDPADIAIGDPTALFPNQYHDPLYDEFPTVQYLDHDGGNASHPRTMVIKSTVPVYWSLRPAGVNQDYVPVPYAEAAYLINLANLKAHTSAGITVCAKNHYGSLRRYPSGTSGYYNLHQTLASVLPNDGQYRALVDLMGHAHIGGKTLICFIDGLYAGIHKVDDAPRTWNSAPFYGDWTSSLFASQDPVAIDSVGFDFLWTEWSTYPHLAGTDDYLHEAAQANNPPSAIFYDPDHPVSTTRLPSLGTHEHWNNAAEKEYSRNLGTGDGIELVHLQWQPGDFDRDGDVDQEDFGRFQACLTGPGTSQTDPECATARLDDDMDVDTEDVALFRGCMDGPGIPGNPNCAD